MATVTLEQEQDRVAAAEEAERPDEAVAERADARRLYKFSRYLHVGPGAEDCDEGEEGTCANPLHFHAWLRLPNKPQHQDIREKGFAAKARRMRALRNQETGANAVLEERLEALRANENVGAIVDELLARDWPRDYLRVVSELAEQDDWKHIDQDRERFARLGESELAKPEDERGDEFKELEAHIGRYLEAVREGIEQASEPRRQALADLGIDGVLDELRKVRIEEEGDAAFLRTYNEWMWYVGTLQPKKHDTTGHAFERYWSSIGTIDEPQPGSMWAAPPEVLEAVEAAFNELDQALQQAARGNS